MSKLIKATLTAGLALILAAGVLPAAATHNADFHSANTSNLFNSPNGRSPAATNSDIAFWGKYAYVGDYGGFRIFDVSNPASPVLVGNMSCPGPQNDLTVFDRDGNGQADIVFASVDSVRAGPDCSAGAAPSPTAPGGWEGLRIFDITNHASPSHIGSVYLDCGSHTNTLWPDPGRNRVLLWNSSYPLGSGPTCGQTTGPPAGRDPNHGVIQIVEAKWDPGNPLGPVTAAEIAEPRITYPGDPDNKFTPAEHGLTAPEPSMRACHDITVYVPFRLAAAACAEQGQLWRVDANGMPDTQNPIWTIDDTNDETGTTGNVNDKGVVVDFWHSATFSWDGKIINFIDESFGSGCPPVTNVGAAVPNRQPGDTGRMFFVDAATGNLLSSYMNPRPLENTYCSAHLGNVVPATDQYLLANAWYAGGASVVDFNNPAAPKEVAWYDIAPAGATGSNNWSLYWYEGPALPEPSLTLYGTDGLQPASGTSARGFQVFKADVNSNEVSLPLLNPQTQELVIGPGGPLVCKGKIATLVGTNGNDVIVGTPAADVVLALGGKDVVKSGNDNDTICAGSGNDTVRAGNSAKGGFDLVLGEGGKDKLFGQGGADRLRGGGGKDLIKAGSGKDRLAGQKGNDALRGQGGADKMNGGSGRDLCNGGAGRDTATKCEKVQLVP